MQYEQVTSVENPSSKVRDEALWQLAKRRAGFKISAVTYILVNCLLIVIWYFTSGPSSYFWPIWSMLGWGIGVSAQYFSAYHGSEIFSIEREYEKLKNKQ